MAHWSEQLTAAMDFSFAELQRLGGKPDLLPKPLRVVVIIISAQGVIDNGGLKYFLETDFPDNPPYSVFVDAYRTIGAGAAADTLAAAIALYPFADPHLSKTKRNEFLDSFNDEDGEPVNSPFEPLSDALCGNQIIWQALDSFVECHSAAFQQSGGSR